MCSKADSMQTVIWVERQRSTKRETGTDVQKVYKKKEESANKEEKEPHRDIQTENQRKKIQTNSELETDKQYNVHREKRNR